VVVRGKGAAAGALLSGGGAHLGAAVAIMHRGGNGLDTAGVVRCPQVTPARVVGRR
jgi:hypothetical protein